MPSRPPVEQPTKYEYAAGYDPQAVIEFLEKQRVRETKIRSSIYKSQTHNKFINAMTTHPMTEDRIRRAQDEIALLPAKNEYVLDTGDFEQVKAKLSHITNECGSAADGSRCCFSINDVVEGYP